ncbi:regulator of chromosome condensation domain-containing protein [Cavenderia fasciculata]|uniref:Regulator of chromosome condensation domain-containing protein n=1 Tax=Cavenderia fasciculata TaxID=261658 RepID=F4Q620_CACFS|nr:regulator of chromosome condensation domain-containing protein [Cavenderia fasciculata]EGG16606.1 regulator of chromosome condensation domain-containing protein [Cavenderia fasciculata]|eukprot:XP_004355080.1 regulator of chromosome condensation domain-containing protein [Cavenderia fasciculata]
MKHHNNFTLLNGYNGTDDGTYVVGWGRLFKNNNVNHLDATSRNESSSSLHSSLSSNSLLNSSIGSGISSHHDEEEQGDGTLGPDTIYQFIGKNPQQLSSGHNHQLLITSGGDIYSWGSNSKGQLGHGDISHNHQIEPIRKFSLLKALYGIVPIQVAAGNEFSMVLTSEGTVYSFGVSNEGQLGNLYDSYNTSSTVINNNNNNLNNCNNISTNKDLDPTNNNNNNTSVNVLLFNSPFGNLLNNPSDTSNNSNESSPSSSSPSLTSSNAQAPRNNPTITQTLIGSTSVTDNLWNHTQPIPRRIGTLDGVQITMVACGSKHTLSLTCDGAVYAWGSNRNGQCGLPLDYPILHQPTRVKIEYNQTNNNSNNNTSTFVIIGSISCGYSHSVAVQAHSSQLYSWGKGSDGQLGLGSRSDHSSPTAIPLFTSDPIVRICCGHYHTVALTSQSKLYSWGMGFALGHGQAKDKLVPTLIEAFSPCTKVVNIACGFSHTAVLTEKGKCLTFGHGDHGQLGYFNKKNESTSSLVPITPNGIDQLQISSISCGWFNTFLIVKDLNINNIQQSFSSSSSSSSNHNQPPQSAEILQSRVKRASIPNVTTSPLDLTESMLQLERLLIEFDVQQSLEMISSFDFVEEKLLDQVQDQNISQNNPGLPTDNSLALSSLARLNMILQPKTKPKEKKKNSNSFYNLISSILFRSNNNNNNYIKPSLAFDQEDLSRIWTDRFIPKWDKRIKNKDEWSFMWRKGGIPPSIRSTVWKLAAGNKLNISEEMYQFYIDIVEKFLKKRNPARYNRGYQPPQKQQQQQPSQQATHSQQYNYIDSDDDENDDHYHRRDSHGRHVDNIIDGDGNEIQYDETDMLLEQTYLMLELDLPRSFPHLFLFHRTAPYHDELMKVLLVWSLYRPEIGYVQGMSYLCGLLLLHMNNGLECFIVFSNMLNSHYFKSLYNFDIQQMVRHIKIYDVLFQKNLPDLYRCFKQVGLVSEHYLLEWLMTLFTKQMSLPIVTRIWDGFLLEGEGYIYAAALGALKLLQKLLLQSPTFDECILTLRSAPQDFKEESLFISIDTIHIPKFCKNLIDSLNKT